MRILLVSGGDGAPFARALGDALRSDDELTVIAPTVRGHWSAGLLASPDLDALLVSAATPPTYAVADSLEQIGYVPQWQRASDDTIAIRLVRTDIATSGGALTDATIAAAQRAALPYRLLPMCEDRAELRVVIGTEDPHAVHVDEYLDDPSAHEPTQLLLVAEGISISSAVSRALLDADLVVIGPSSRTLAVDPVLRTPGFLDLVAPDLPVLVVDHEDQAPADLIRVAGLRETVPGRTEPVAPDAAAVIEHARLVVS
ncbi:2-phospho-L-lactate transferase CofD family protein [Aeromicrobium sp.]|uniref:2-phospho-L-lactate transferase CofD family protein n=1 Tax=Aeromicrobium sp. TaxID=1871063 RepID=UPI0030BD33A4